MCGLGLTALRFNFRGVGASAWQLCRRRQASSRTRWRRSIGLRRRDRHRHCGSRAFRSAVALRCRRPCCARCVSSIAVAPAVERCALGGPPTCPWLVVQGLEDELVDSRVVREWAAARKGAVDLVELAGVDHFFHGRLTELKKRIGGEARGGGGSACRGLAAVGDPAAARARPHATATCKKEKPEAVGCAPAFLHDLAFAADLRPSL